MAQDRRPVLAPADRVRGAVRALTPGYFALVMATGIASIAMRNHDADLVSAILLWLTITEYAVLVIAWCHRTVSRSDGVGTPTDRPKEDRMSATTSPDEHASIEIDRDGRAFRIEYEPSPLATGWMLRERHHDGWPILAGPFDARQDAIDDIEELLEAGPLCRYVDENGHQSCWV